MAKRVAIVVELLDTLGNVADQATTVTVTAWLELEFAGRSHMAERRAAAVPAAALVLMRAKLVAMSSASRAETHESPTACASSVSHAPRRYNRLAQVCAK